jgi:hypothetical protein
VSVRLDAPTGGAGALSSLSVSVLAFRATSTGLSASEVLSAVDPLVALPPEGRCEMRDVAGAARAVRAQGGAIELEELADVQVSLGGASPGGASSGSASPGGASPGSLSATVLRPAPRVYPQLAAVVGGVIGEAGPIEVASLPERISLAFVDAAASATATTQTHLPVPALPRVLDQDGNPLASGGRIDITGDLPLAVTGPARSFLEIRPFGAPIAIACAVAATGRVLVPYDLMERLRAASGRVPVSFEAVFRQTHSLAPGAAGAGAGPTAPGPVQISLEARSSAVLELRP